MKETDTSEKILEIVIYSELESKILLQKEDLICDLLIDKYPKTLLEYIILVDPYGKYRNVADYNSENPKNNPYLQKMPHEIKKNF